MRLQSTRKEKKWLRILIEGGAKKKQKSTPPSGSLRILVEVEAAQEIS